MNIPNFDLLSVFSFQHSRVVDLFLPEIVCKVGKVCKVEKVRSTFYTFYDYLNFCEEKKDDRLLTIYFSTHGNPTKIRCQKSHPWHPILTVYSFLTNLFLNFQQKFL